MLDRVTLNHPLKPFRITPIKDLMMTTSMTIPNIRARLQEHATLRDRSVAGDYIIWALAILPPAMLMIVVALQPWIDPGMLLRDPLAVAEMSPNCCKVYYGAVSNLGVLVWMSAAAICLFAALTLLMLKKPTGDVLFFLAAGLFTAFLTIDDLFLVHENVLPAFGVPQPVTYAAYGLIGLAYLWLSRWQILENRYLLLVTALILLSVSVTVDWFFHSDHTWRILIEDGAKITGIFAWTMFHATAALNAISGQPNHRTV